MQKEIAYVDSTLAYQGYAHGYDIDTIQSVHAIITNGYVPDLTIILDIDVESGLDRAKGWVRGLLG